MRLRIAIIALSVAAALVPNAARWAAGSDPSRRSVAHESAGGQEPQRFYVGAKSCSADGCHGNAQPSDAATRPRSAQTEFHTWKEKDKHSQAFAVLKNELSQQIARHLKLDTPPEKSIRCLNCHSMNALPDRRGINFALEDGVSCDGCHGPASDWLASHALPNQSYADSLTKGMKDIRNPIVRAEMCLSCHLGNRADGKTVDHEIYAAGHPPLVFEVDAFSHKLPPHWREKIPSGGGGSLPRAQTWAAGQVVALREAARLLAEDAKSDRWPEYSHFDCAACHHDLSDADWRQRRPARGKPGRPLWQGAQSAAAARAIGGTESLADAVATLDRHLTAVPFGRAKDVSASAEQLSNQLNDLAKAVAGKSISADEARKLAAALCDLAARLAWRGPAAAQQLAFALHALLSQSMPPDSPAVKEVEQLVKELSEPQVAYDPQRFGERIQTIRKQLQ